MIKFALLILLSLWSFKVWAAYFETKAFVENYHYKPTELSEGFWQWEAQGRLNLIDNLIAKNFHSEHKKLINYSYLLSYLQIQSYGLEGIIDPPRFVFAHLKGDGNAVYFHEDKTVYLNKRMNWKTLPPARFQAVVFHETMHHILSHYGAALNEDHPLYDDFQILAEAAKYNNHSHVNLQEYVTYRSERAALFSTLYVNDYAAYDVTLRMKEITLLKQAAF